MQYDPFSNDYKLMRSTHCKKIFGKFPCPVVWFPDHYLPDGKFPGNFTLFGQVNFLKFSGLRIVNTVTINTC